MLNLDEEIIIEGFAIFYNRLPNLNSEGDQELIHELIYILNYFHVYLYEHAQEGEYPHYTIKENGRLYSELVGNVLEVLAKKQYRYPLANTIRNKEEVKEAKNTLYNFSRSHKEIKLHDIAIIDYSIKHNLKITNINNKDLNDTLELLNYIKNNYKQSYQRKRVYYERKRIK